MHGSNGSSGVKECEWAQAIESIKRWVLLFIAMQCSALNMNNNNHQCTIAALRTQRMKEKVIFSPHFSKEILFFVQFGSQRILSVSYDTEKNTHIKIYGKTKMCKTRQHNKQCTSVECALRAHDTTKRNRTIYETKREEKKKNTTKQNSHCTFAFVCAFIALVSLDFIFDGKYVLFSAWPRQRQCGLFSSLSPSPRLIIVISMDMDCRALMHLHWAIRFMRQ